MGKKRFEARNCAQQWKDRRLARLAKEKKADAKSKAKKAASQAAE